MRGRLLFAFGNIASARLQFILARRLAGDWRVSFLYWGEKPEERAQVSGEIGSVGDVSTPSDYPETLAEPLRLPLRARAIEALIATATTLTRSAESLRPYELVHDAALKRAHSALRAIDPAALVVSEDGVSSHLPLIAAARQRRIPVVDVPFGYAMRSDFDRDLERKASAGELRRASGADGLLLRLLAPQWVDKGRFAGAVMFPPPYILAAEAKGITLRDAWTVHGGLADRLCAESQENLERYLEEGIPQSKCELTGSPYCDDMVDAVAGNPAAQEALCKPQPIEPGRLKVLVSWPPSYHDQRGDQNEFGTYEEMTRRIFRGLRAVPGTEVTASLHPACAPETRSWVEAEGVAVSDDYVIRLIPQHDVFVTYFSSTIRWAIAAGKPVINYDAYRLGIDIYDRAGGFTNVETLQELTSRMAALAGEPAAFSRMTAEQCRAAPRWGLLDGRCCERIAALIGRLVAGGRNAT
jgi:hypothetical protein